MYYHISPIKNKEIILQEGLKAKKLNHVYLALTYFDAFLLAPITYRYMESYKMRKDLYNSQSGILYKWEPDEFNASLFEIDESDLDIIEKHNYFPAKVRFKNFNIDKDSSEQYLIEYLTNEVPPDKIRHVKDLNLILWNYIYLSDKEVHEIIENVLQIAKGEKCSYNAAVKIYKEQNSFKPYPELYIPEEEPHILKV